MEDKVANTIGHEAERPLVVFSLDGRRYGLELDLVSRVIRAVAVTPLPQAPSIILGVIDLGGAVIPVVDIRRRFNLPPREIRLSDQLVIAAAGGMTVALLVDDTPGVIDARSEICSGAGKILPGAKFIDGAVTLDDGLVLIHDLGRLLSLEEETAIAGALNAAGFDAAANRAGGRPEEG